MSEPARAEYDGGRGERAHEDWSGGGLGSAKVLKSIAKVSGNVIARVAPLSSARSVLRKADKAKKDAEEAAAKAAAKAAAAKIPKKSSEELQEI